MEMNIQQINNLLNNFYGKNTDEQSMLNEVMSHLKGEIAKGKFITVLNPDSTSNLQIIVAIRENNSEKQQITITSNSFSYKVLDKNDSEKKSYSHEFREDENNNTYHMHKQTENVSYFDAQQKYNNSNFLKNLKVDKFRDYEGLKQTISQLTITDIENVVLSKNIRSEITSQFGNETLAFDELMIMPENYASKNSETLYRNGLINTESAYVENDSMDCSSTEFNPDDINNYLNNTREGKMRELSQIITKNISIKFSQYNKSVKIPTNQIANERQ